MRTRKKMALLVASIVGVAVILASCGETGDGGPSGSTEKYPSIPERPSSSAEPAESTSSSTSQPDDEKTYEATWSTGTDGIPVLTKYTVHGEPPTGNLVLPNEGTYKIGEWLFAQNQQITSVTIPEGVVEIENRAFLGCKNITKVALPSTLKNIGYAAFSCTGIKEIKIPEFITTISEDTFRDCQNLTSVIFPSQLKTIGKGAFWGTRLESISLPTGLSQIGDDAFYGTNIKEWFLLETMRSTVKPLKRLYCQEH